MMCVRAREREREVGERESYKDFERRNLFSAEVSFSTF